MGNERQRSASLRSDDDRRDNRPTAEARKGKARIEDGHYGEGEVWGFIFIAGPTGSGKSVEANRIVERSSRCVKFIPPNVTFANDGKWPVLSQPGQLRDFIAANRKGQMRCIYVPASQSDVEEHFEFIVRMVRRAQNCILYIDEVDQLCSPNGMMSMRSAYWQRPENKLRRPSFSDLLDSGRHDGIALVMMSRMPAQVNIKVRNNVQEMRIFRTSEPGVLKYFADRIGSDAAEAISRLGDYEYVLWQDGKKFSVGGGRR